MFNWRQLLLGNSAGTTTPSAPSAKHVAADTPTSKSSPSQRYLDRYEQRCSRANLLIVTIDSVKAFESCLSAPIIPLVAFRAISFSGIPDKNGLRSICWKVLLGYLPTATDQWTNKLDTQRAFYHRFCIDLLIDPFDKSLIRPSSSSPPRLPPTNDDPLSISGSSSGWSQFFDDKSLRDEIGKDVARTHAAIHFFTQRIDYRDALPRSQVNASGAILDRTKRQNETHHDVLSRILFLFARLNPGVRYVQGMNEVLAPIYYVFAQDPDPTYRVNAEADAFFCFTVIMSELKDLFMASLDSAESGIVAAIEDFRDLLRRADPDLYLHLETHNVDARYYSLRWLTLLCSQEFHLPDVLRLWDSLLADARRFDFLRYACCAMLVCIRERLLAMGYADMLQTLQRYPQVDMTDILDCATRIRQTFGPAALLLSPK